LRTKRSFNYSEKCSIEGQLSANSGHTKETNHAMSGFGLSVPITVTFAEKWIAVETSNCYKKELD
jgi:hypothetical protein